MKNDLGIDAGAWVVMVVVPEGDPTVFPRASGLQGAEPHLLPHTTEINECTMMPRPGAFRSSEGFCMLQEKKKGEGRRKYER